MVKGVTLERYYVVSLGGRGWPKCNFIHDRSTTPHIVVNEWLKTRKAADRRCAELNAEAGPDWQRVRDDERDSLTRLREWAASTRAFTEAPYDPDVIPTSFIREAA